MGCKAKQLHNRLFHVDGPSCILTWPPTFFLCNVTPVNIMEETHLFFFDIKGIPMPSQRCTLNKLSEATQKNSCWRGLNKGGFFLLSKQKFDFGLTFFFFFFILSFSSLSLSQHNGTSSVPICRLPTCDDQCLIVYPAHGGSYSLSGWTCQWRYRTMGSPTSIPHRKGDSWWPWPVD